VEALSATGGEARDEVRVEVARSLGRLADPGLRGVVETLAGDESARVAGEAILAMGTTHDAAYVPDLLAWLPDPRRRPFARAALVEFGNDVVATLRSHLGDEGCDPAVRRNLPAVLSRIPTQPSADALASGLGRGDPTMRYRVVKALNKLRRRYPNLEIDGGVVDAAFVDEAREYYHLLAAAALHRQHGDEFLSRALEERLVYTLERIFRLLGLRYPADDVYNAYLGLVGDARPRRSSAVELLDNVLDAGSKRYLLPIIDRVSEAATIARGGELFGVGAATRDDSLVRLIAGRDPWLRACAVFTARANVSGAVRVAVEAASGDPDVVVAQTARLLLGAWKSSKGTRPMFTVIEKVILLQSVDVFSDISTEQLAYLAAISEEVSYLKGETIYETGEASDSLYLVVEGRVRLHRDGDDILQAGRNDVFGTWALFDEEPRVATATVVEPTRLLRIDRDDFLELLSDHTEITQGLFKHIVGRLRGLIGRVAPR
jgi:HEAT repeat protein